MKQKILVVGAGAIGGYFGGRLLAAGEDVTFLVRPRRAALLAEHGLNIRSPRGDVSLPNPPTVQAGAITAPFDSIILSCKAFDLGSAIESFAPAVGPTTKILPLLNGMAHLDALVARFGESAVLGGQCAISTTLEDSGTIRQFGDMQAVSLGERTGPASPTAEALAAALAPQNGRLSETILQDMWEKWVFITTIACTTCLMRTTIGDVVAAGATEIPLAIGDECAAIATSAGYAPRPAARDRLRAMMTTPGSPLTASMLRDIERGGPIEVDHVVGDLLNRGADGGSPTLRIAYLHLKAYEARRTRLHS
ncbi:ketopantoate reductase family protein [Acidisphaera sp. L21]|uniref:ketopantoate reductase family protein n=1 Tax=Acidisphaera sp. L21 TaxID=1641851 RepID=UPI00131D4F7E|nr:ketopantoate reductase family protein [Acidisphaera sp. L21]